MRFPFFSSAPPPLFPKSPLAWAVFGATLAMILFYAWSAGTVLVLPDVLYFADRARHLLEEGTFAQSAFYPSVPPLYGLLLLPVYIFENLKTGHALLVVVQSLLLASAWFPLRGLILNNGAEDKAAASFLAGLVLLLPAFASYAPLTTPEALLIPLLIYAVYFLDRIFSQKADAAAGWGAGLFLGLAALTQQSASVIWLAAVISLALTRPFKSGARERRAVLTVALLPPLLWLAWRGMSFLMGEAVDQPFAFNNALARFNFVKNALLYICYGGAPLAGLALVLAGLMKGKSFWREPFFRFSFLALAGVALYAAFTNDVIVAKKLDYITNRVIEPYLFLPLIVFLRLDGGTRREILTNGLMILFVLMVLGLPGALNLDFISGFAFFTGTALTPAGVLTRNVLYLALAALLVLALYLRPKSFLPVYALVLLFVTGAGLTAASGWWRGQDDAQFAAMPAQAFARNPEFRAAGKIYLDTRCKEGRSSDVAYLYGCFDMSKSAYFLPKPPKPLRAAQIAERPFEEIDGALFASTENDNRLGPTVAQAGMTRFVRLSKDSLHELKTTPLVQITGIKGLRQYINIPVRGRLRRMTMLDQESSFTLRASRTGCSRFSALLFADDHPRKLAFRLNDGRTRTIRVPVLGHGPQRPASITLRLPEGESVLHLSYGGKDDLPQIRNLILFEKPVFESCGR